jgi:hypothetical protein
MPPPRAHELARLRSSREEAQQARGRLAAATGGGRLRLHAFGMERSGVCQQDAQLVGLFIGTKGKGCP